MVRVALKMYLKKLELYLKNKVKTPAQIESMRRSGQILANILEKLRMAAQPGVTTKELDALARTELKTMNARSAFLGYNGFPGVVCVSVNDEVVHGIPGSRVLAEGDLVGLDFGVVYEGMYTDSAISCVVGQSTPQQDALIKACKEALDAGIGQVKNGSRVGDISAAIERRLRQDKLGVVETLVGHGVGHELHEEPAIPNFGLSGRGPKLTTGMTIAIEPMATTGGHEVVVDSDGWTIRTKDGSISAHFEHTVLVTDDGFEIMTQLRA